MGTTHSVHSGQRASWLPGIAMLVAILATSFTEKTARAADGSPLSYTGRLTQSSGAPVEGPVDIELRFYPSETEGSPLADPYTFTNVALQNGMFSLSVQLTTKDAQTVLGTGSEPVFVEVTAAGRVYPRQRFSFVPYALRIPVDDSSLVYDKTSGKLSINGSGTATLGQILTSDGNGKVRWDKLSSFSLSAQTAAGDQPGEDQILTYKNGKWVAGNLVDIPSSFGSVTSVTAAPPLTVTTPSTTPALSITQASGTTGGYLSSADWTAFHSKQAAGNYLTELTGDIVATGPGSGSASLAPIALPGTATKITFDAKGRVTAGTSLTAADVSGALGYAPLGSVSIQTGTGLTGGPITTSGTITLADTAVTPGTYARANIVVDAQGRLTGAESAPLVSDADIAAGAAIAQSKIQGLVSDLSGKEPNLPNGGGAAQFLAGTKTWQSLNTSLVTEDQANLYYSNDRARAAITATPPLNYFTVTGMMTIPKADGTADGYLSSGDWSKFNTKQDDLGFVPLNKAGDTISGAMDFIGNDLLAVGNVQIAAAKTLGLGVYTTDPTTLTAADKGKTWFNSSANQMKYWDGTAVQVVGAVGAAVASLNGQSGPSQSFGTPGSTGTAPAWSSNSNVHTLNIPMASATGVTAGLLANADYATFNAKQPAGNYITAITGDVTASGPGSITATLATVATAGTYTKVNIDTKGRVLSGTTLVSGDITNTLGFTPLNRAGDTTTGKLEMASAVINGNVGVGTTSPHSSLQVSGSVATAITVRSANSTLTSNDSIVLANASSSPFTLTLPSASGIAGRTYSIKKSDSTTNVVTINATGAELIDGAASVSLANPYQTLQLASDGANWSRIGGEAWGHTGADVWRQQGNVGVGTSSPSTKLDVNGQIKIQGGSPGAGKVLTSDSVGLGSWTTPAIGTITGVTAGSGLTGGGSAGAVSLAVDVGTTANKIVRLDNNAALPAIDGAALTNLSPNNLGTVVPLGKGGTGSSLLLTGGSGQYLKQTVSGANVSVGPIAVGDLPTLVGDTGSGGSAGIVPAPAGGDSTAGKYLKADGSWSVPPGITNWSAPGSIGTTTPNAGSFTNVLANGNVGIGTNTARTTLDLSARTDALALPTGTTAQQPSSPQAGWIRHNSTTTLLEYFNGTAWMPATNAVSPAGMIAPFPTSTCPTGWLEADGAAVSRTTYAALFTMLGSSYGSGNGTTTFNLPDYRGYFMRGWSHGSGNDPDAASRTSRGDGTTADNVGSKQNDAFQDHTHATYATDDGGRYDSTTAQGGQTYLQSGYNTLGAATGRAAAETRPKNIYVTYCVSTQLLPTTTVASTGSGNTSYVPQWTSSTALGNSPIVINNGNVGIGSNTPAKALDIGSGSVRAGGFERADGTPLYSGDIYTRWGNATAPAGTELLYSGFAYSAFYNHSGSGNTTCFKTNGTAGTVAYSYGDLLYAADVHHLHNDGVPSHTMVKCAVYYSPRPRAVIWGDNTCPANWTLSYHGYAIGSYYTHPAPMERICLDVQNIDTSVNVVGAKAHMYATNLYQGFAELGNPPTNRNLRCAVCQKN